MTLRKPLPYLLAFVLGVGAAALTACGSTNKAMVPAENASKLKSDLDEVLNAVDAHDCGRASQALSQVRADLDSLPAGTSVRLKRRLSEGAATLQRQAGKECVKTTSTPTTPTETQTTTTATIPTTTTDTTATVPTTPTTTTPPTVPTTPTTQTTPTTTNDTGGAVTP